MASPGIRSYHIARTLAQQLPDAKVTLIHAGDTDLEAGAQPFQLARFEEKTLRSIAARQDIIIANQFPRSLFRLSWRKRMVLDLYTPFFTEWREFSKVSRKPALHQAFMDSKQHELLSEMAIADFFLCATDRQRDLYIGMLSSMGLISTRGYDDDTSLRRLIAIAPFGIRPRPARAVKRRLKGVHPQIRETDMLIIWNGSIFEWYDVETLIRAVHRLGEERDDIKLFFMGAEHPDFRTDTQFGGMGGGAVREAVGLSRELGLLDRLVFFNFDWANEQETEDYLLESDIGVCTYRASLETRFSFRVRYLDLFWASVPIVCTKGDIVADMVETRGLGLTIGEGDVDGLVAAIRRLADDAEFRNGCKRSLGEVREEFGWELTLAPLIDYCKGERQPLVSKRDRLMPAIAQIAGWARASARFRALSKLRRDS